MKLTFIFLFIFSFSTFADIPFVLYQQHVQSNSVAENLQKNAFYYSEISLNLEGAEELPKELEEIPNLRSLKIFGNLGKIKQWDLLCSLKSLEKIVFTDRCELSIIPKGLEKIPKIKLLVFRFNPVRYIPFELAELLENNEQLTIDMQDTNFAIEDSEEGRGYYSLYGLDESQLLVSKYFTMYGSDPIFTWVMGEEIMQFLSELKENHLLSLNPTKLRQCKGTPFSPNHDWNPKRFIGEFDNLLSSFELEDQTSPNYLDYAFFRDSIEEIDPSTKGCSKTNEELIRGEVFTRLRGFVKKLFGLPILQGQKLGSQPHPWDREVVRGILARAVEIMNGIKDPQEKCAKFVQLKGLLHCVEGYIEGLNTIFFSDENYKEGELGLETILRRMFISVKQTAFNSAAIDGDFFQSAHQINYYGHYLRDMIGLYTCAQSIEELSCEQETYDKEVGTKTVLKKAFSDDYYGHSKYDVRLGESHPNTGNRIEFRDSNDNIIRCVLEKLFFKQLRALFLARQLLDGYETKEDYIRNAQLQKIDTKNYSRYLQIKQELKNTKREFEKAKQKWRLEYDDLDVKLDEEYNKRRQAGKKITAKFERRVDNIIAAKNKELKQISDDYDQKIAVLNEQLAKNFSTEEKEKIKKYVELRKEINKNRSLRPLSFSCILVFLREKGLIKEDDSFSGYENLGKYFDLSKLEKDSLDEPAYAPLTIFGALRILVDTGYLELNYNAYDKESSNDLIADYANDLKKIYCSNNYTLPEYLSCCPLEEQIFSLQEITKALHEKRKEEISNLLSSQGVKGALLEESFKDQASENEEDFMLKINEFEQECKKEMVALETQWDKNIEQGFLTEQQKIKNINAEYNQEKNILEKSIQNIKYLSFADVIKSMIKAHLVGSYDEHSQIYPGMEKYFDIATLVFNHDNQIIHAEFLVSDETQIGIAQFIMDMGFIVGAFEDKSAELILQIAQSQQDI